MKRRVWKVAGSLAVLTVIATGVVALAIGPAEAGPLPGPIGGPLCGWSTLWDCTMPDGSHQIVGGTQCDIAVFEKQTGATCVILRF